MRRRASAFFTFTAFGRRIVGSDEKVRFTTRIVAVPFVPFAIPRRAAVANADCANATRRKRDMLLANCAVISWQFTLW
jgi:hypothetical protein